MKLRINKFNVPYGTKVTLDGREVGHVIKMENNIVTIANDDKEVNEMFKKQAPVSFEIRKL